VESEQNDGCANDILRPYDSEAIMVLPIKTPNAQIFAVTNIPYSILVFHGLIQVNGQLGGICYMH
jgi:hypothetical protein